MGWGDDDGGYDDELSYIEAEVVDTHEQSASDVDDGSASEVDDGVVDIGDVGLEEAMGALGAASLAASTLTMLDSKRRWERLAPRAARQGTRCRLATPMQQLSWLPRRLLGIL